MYGPGGNWSCPDSLPKKLSKRNGPNTFDTPGNLQRLCLIDSQHPERLGVIAEHHRAALLGPQYEALLADRNILPQATWSRRKYRAGGTD